MTSRQNIKPSAAQRLVMQPLTDAAMREALDEFELVCENNDVRKLTDDEKYAAQEFALSLIHGDPSAEAEATEKLVPMLTLTGSQLLEALDLIAPDRTADQLESEGSFQYGKGHAGEGMYCWITEYPEEGASLLDGSTVSAQAVAVDGAQLDQQAAMEAGWAKTYGEPWYGGNGVARGIWEEAWQQGAGWMESRAAVSPATAEPDLNALLEAAAVGLNREGMDEDARIVRGMKPGYPPKRNEPATADERAARDDGFFAGVCVALQVITAFDQGVMWAELVRACGTDELLQYAAHVEPEEWQLAGFEKYAFNELRKKKPKAGARASQAAAPAEAREPIYQSRLLKAPAWTDVSRTEFEACAAKPDQFEVRTLSPVTADAGEAAALRAEVDRLNAIINTPQAGDFLRAVSIEAEHQRQRWSCKHDSGKMPADWFWLVGYLAGKALHAHAVCDEKKAEHHIITTAAALANWHLAIFGKSDMRPGTELPSEKPRDCSGTPESCPDNEGYGCHCSDAARAQGGKGGDRD
ncbi:hypothetical protein [Burkholderia gladioli]|uniref:hypothetical protein n=1 Tax=Burkholderia gladioli TaxID=28095 RepID=UPI001ABB60ED|nr:hypothetical protein [Burkholderia gladioli]